MENKQITFSRNNSFFLFFILAFFLLNFSPSAQADHLAGAQITTKNIGGNSYEVTLTFYRDCSGIAAPASVLVFFKCSSNPTVDFSLILQPLPGGIEITNSCTASPTSCAGGFGYGVQEYVYQAVVTLIPCNSWTISHRMCCRNLSNTIVNPLTSDAYFEANLNNASAPGNSSPVFTNYPINITCENQTWCYNHGAVDIDGDSLSYSLVTPWALGPGTSNPYVAYIPPYTATQPLPSTPPVSIDPVSGDICMTPTQIIIAPIAVLVEEWRTINGVPTKIGHIVRDMQINVINCTNDIPQLSGMDFHQSNAYNPLDTLYYHELCLGNSMDFNIWGFDADTANPSSIGQPEIMNISWNQGISSGTFSVHNNNTDSAFANFNWTPTATDVRPAPHCFTASVTDEACPYKGNQTYSYCIVVKGMTVDLGDDTVLCNGESFDIFAISDTSTQNYNWDIDGSPAGIPITDTMMTFNSNLYSKGLHFVAIEVDDGSPTTAQCPGIDTVWINNVEAPNVNLPNDTAFCYGGNIILDAGVGGMYIWNTGDTTQTLLVDTTGTYQVYVDGNSTYKSHCHDKDSIRLNVIPYPIVDLGPDTCSNIAPIYLFGKNDPNVYNYHWTDGQGNAIGSSILVGVNYSSLYTLEITGKANSSCKDVGTRLVNILTGDKIRTEINAVDFGFGDQNACPHQEITLFGPTPPTGHSYAYLWTLDGNLLGTTEQVNLNKQSLGTHHIGLDVGNGCYGEINIEVDYCPITIPNVVTPDGNSINDVFKIDGLEAYPGSKMLIFNRWGRVVFESNDYQVGMEWNPRDLADGVYYYVFYVADGIGTQMSGTVTVIR